MSVLIIDALNDRGKGSTSKGERDHTSDHHDCAKDFFLPARDRDVTIAHGCDSRDSEVKGGQVLLVGAQNEVIPSTHPCVLTALTKVGHHYPDAAN